MTNIIVAFSKLEDAKSIKNVLMKHGFNVIASCTSGAQVLSFAEALSEGIVVSGYRFPDMMFTELRELLPNGIDMLMVSSPNRWPSRMPDNIVCLAMPLKVHELLDNVSYIAAERERRRRKRRQSKNERSDAERAVIMAAKELLIQRNNMTEEEAHRYLQKCSMDSGTGMVETAQMVMSLMNN